MSAARLVLDLETAPQVRHLHRVPARAGVDSAWPSWVSQPVRESFGRLGIAAPWAHQVRAAEAALAGRHVVLSTGTASGKTLGYLLPVLAAITGQELDGHAAQPVASSPRLELMRSRRPHTALYLAPTKALAHDQLRSCRELGLDTLNVATLDGDTDRADRDWVRDHATYVLTNPDMLHCSVLPQHQRWAQFLSALRYVVVDESHRYRGVFGAHVAAVLRRLRRIAARYGANPTFILASATASNAGWSAGALIGVDQAEVLVVDQDSSAHGSVEMVLWEPDETAEDDAARLLAQLVDEGRQTIAFVQSRKSAERVAASAAGLVTSGARVDCYRGGYLADDRRALERALQQGHLTGVAATNALELGVDIAGMDAVVIAGFPGTRAALWQQAGRAGRKGGDASVFLIARQQPLDAYLFDHPNLLFSSPVEATVLHPDNPYVLGPHLAAAAQESPLTPADDAWFGDGMLPLVERLTTSGVLRRRSGGWFWTRPERAVDGINLRSASGPAVEIVERETGRVLGHIDAASVDATVHPGAIYLHQGETYLVDDLDLECGEALVRAARPGYYTQPRVRTGISVSVEHRSRALGAGHVHSGTVHVTSQVTGYLRRDEVTGAVWDETPLDLEEHSLRTEAVWWTLDPELVRPGLTPEQLAGGAHAAEHTAVGLLPMFAPCDRWDIGSASTASHVDTGTLTVFVHDGQAGGAGFAERGYQMAEEWLTATLDRLRSCPCEAGCPSCVVSPTCGQVGQVLNKAMAAVLLGHLCR